MKSIITLVMLFSLNALAKEPTKEFLSRKIGIWVPALIEPEAKNYTLNEFVNGAFRNVTSKSWEETDDSWILIIKIKDPMTKKKSTAKMQFLKSDKVAGPRRIVMDGEDFPMNQASNVMHPLLANIAEKIGSKNTKKTETSSDKFEGKFCGSEAKFFLRKKDSENKLLDVRLSDCETTERNLKVLQSVPNRSITLELEPKCNIELSLNSSDNKSDEINAKFDCSLNQLKQISGCALNRINGSFSKCDY